MKNNLLKKIGKRVFLPLLLGGLSLINSGCNERYFNQKESKRFILNSVEGELTKKRGGIEYNYFFNPQDSSLQSVILRYGNSFYNFYEGDSLFNDFEKMYMQDMDEVDSLRKAKDFEYKNSYEYKKKIEVGERALGLNYFENSTSENNSSEQKNWDSSEDIETMFF